MKFNKLKLYLTFLLIFSLVFIQPLSCFGESTGVTEIYIGKGFTIKRTIDGDSVFAETTDKDGNTYIASYIDGVLRLDDEIIMVSTNMDFLSSKSEFDFDSTDYMVMSDVVWGSWSTSSETIQTGGKSTYAIATLISVVCPWVGFSLLLDVAAQIAYNYDSIVIKWKMRYGEDNTYIYYQRYTSIYGNGTLIGGPWYDSRKKDKYL